MAPSFISATPLRLTKSARSASSCRTPASQSTANFDISAFYDRSRKIDRTESPRRADGERVKSWIASAVLSLSLILPQSLTASPVQDYPLRLKSSALTAEYNTPALKVKWEGVRSINSRYETYVLFENQSTSTVDINWVTYDGGEEIYASMAPGSVHLQPSYATHPWSMRNHVTQDGLLGGIIVAGKNPKVAVVREQGVNEEESERGEGLLKLFGKVHGDNVELNTSSSKKVPEGEP